MNMQSAAQSPAPPPAVSPLPAALRRFGWHLLPALPPELASGEVTGFNLRGAMQLSLRWQEGRVVAMTVTAPAEGEKSFRIGSITRSIRLRAGENVLNDVLSGFYG